MCRLYALMANESTRAECSLVRSQNSLMRQSEGDSEGVVHGHGWGVADYTDGRPVVEKQAWAAYHGEHFPMKAARVHARAVIAHVRRATVGQTSIENTHPFPPRPLHLCAQRDHPGLRPGAPAHARARPIRCTAPRSSGQTDSEHLFHYLLTCWSRGPQSDLARHGPRGPGARAGVVSRDRPRQAGRAEHRAERWPADGGLAAEPQPVVPLSRRDRPVSRLQAARTYTTNREPLTARWRWHRSR